MIGLRGEKSCKVRLISPAPFIISSEPDKGAVVFFPPFIYLFIFCKHQFCVRVQVPEEVKLFLFSILLPCALPQIRIPQSEFMPTWDNYNKFGVYLQCSVVWC